MSVDDGDTRKVQTAVAGRASSDEPVFMPFDADDFDRFIEHYPERSFYCGILLGGCGKRLSAKRYVDKKCHFAHHPPVHCKRTANSESSADHLYIGKALQLWFAQQGQRGINPSYRPSGHQVGEAVDLVHSAGRHVLRVQMSRLSKAEWEAADAELASIRDQVEWLFGQGDCKVR
ncbi:competence protein CoiA family protein [Actinacidiphila glaucinigra]|uniref:competence protein CoiA family protein n=1 Tax=Actinacidiphila glaucinigra TaxID=235986 RepID=UPI0037B05F79